MKHYLIVIDMQTDFINGSLGSPEAVSIKPAVIDLIHTFPALLQARASYFWTIARLEGYESTLACQLDLSDVPPLVHDLLCQAFHKGENALHAYVDAHLAAQGLDGMMIGAVSSAPEGKICGPVAGNIGTFIFRVNSREAGSFFTETDAKNNAQQMNNYTTQMILPVMMEEADVKDHRARFF